jgi:DNA repair protein RecN (Recombination protein N)
MLKELRVDNYVLIKTLQFNPTQGFNIITGETGAGKSILIGALGLILGERADTKMVSESGDKCIIEGVFDISKLKLQPLFDTYDLDYYDETILRREILISGKSRAFINDTPVGLNVLKEIGGELVDIHSQHQSLLLGSQHFLLNWLDTVCGTLPAFTTYSQSYLALNEEQKRLDLLQDEVDKQTSEQDYHQFLFNELEEADLEALLASDLESEYEVLQNAEEIGEVIGQALNGLKEDEDSALSRITSLNHQLKKLKGGESLQEILDRLTGVQLEFEEVINDLSHFGLRLQPDAQRLEEINDLMAKLHLLQTKHKALDIQGLIDIRNDLSDKLSLNFDRENELKKLQDRISELSADCLSQAKKLHKYRLKSITQIESKANADLLYLGLPNAELKLDLTEAEALTKYGLSHFQLLFSSNKGMSLRPAHKVASGGELSRLMLILKSYLAQNKNLPTLIFDEIDTGVSGEIALKMGEMMSALSAKMQVVSITHLPQIASKGNAHFYVYKQLDKDQTMTFVKQLDGTERIMVLAQMLSGENPTEGAIANAKELLN